MEYELEAPPVTVGAAPTCKAYASDPAGAVHVEIFNPVDASPSGLISVESCVVLLIALRLMFAISIFLCAHYPVSFIVATADHRIALVASPVT